MKSRGFTLVEILIVVAIMAILLAAVTHNFNFYQKKAKIDQQTEALYSTIMTARLTAIQRKQRSVLFLGPRNYTFKSYSSPYEPRANGNTVMSSSFFNEVKKKTGATQSTLNIANDFIDFDARGFTDNSITLVVTPLMYSGASDCIVVQTARSNIGRMENVSTCRVR
jgi:prepilin-type N-terminal cleavage/methylation domain-containing protein